MAQLGEQSLTVTRQAPGAYSTVTGEWEDGGAGPSTFEIVASVQPVTPKLIEMMPEGSREAARFSLYAEADQMPLFTVDIEDGRRPDRLAYTPPGMTEERSYWVQSIGDWTSDESGIPHYEYVLLSIGEDEPGG